VNIRKDVALRTRKRLGELLVEANLITGDQLNQALADQKNTELKLGQFLVLRGIIKEEQIIDMLSKQLKIKRYRPDKNPVNPELAKLIPMNVAQENSLVPIKKKKHLIVVAMTDPMDINAVDKIERLTNMEVEAFVCSERELNQMTNSIYGIQSGVFLPSEKIEEASFNVQKEPEESEDIQVSSLQNMAEEAPVVRLVNSIISQAIRGGASDVHLSPKANSIQLRFRIDGRLHEVQPPPKNILLPIVSRIKILANMDIAISRIPQDGRFTVRMDNREINIRASSIPTIYGENVVLRLLDMSADLYSLDHLGMFENDRKKLESIVVKPHGMILSTGPTGSGKSTSLYAILDEINSPDINIITLEDPVEYRVETIRQVQLNRKAGMTFASGLRSILRQDPDVILVGEIRDAETASIATQAALTGHRVLSTVHTNDAAGAITRLLDMGIEPFLVSSVLLVSFAQRLVRTICPYCKESYRPPQSALAQWGLDKIENAKFNRGKGCQQCMNTGYSGRTGIFEVLIVDEMVQEMILRGMPAQEINRILVEAGKMKTLREDAAEKVVQGITTLEEAMFEVMI
jgi:type IV pilus assembly protein PilB